MRIHFSTRVVCCLLSLLCMHACILPGCSTPTTPDSDSPAMDGGAATASPSSPAVTSGTSGTASLPSEATEYFIFVADGLPADLRGEVKRTVSELISHGAAGSVIHLIRTPDHSLIASIDIPEGTLQKRIRDRDLLKSMPQITAFLDDISAVPEDFRGQLGLSQLPDSFWSNKKTELPTRIILVGEPVFHDPAQAIWSFREGKYPSDSCIVQSVSTLPLKRVGRQRIPDDTMIAWITPDDFGVDQLHRDAISRFYVLLFEKSVGGTLAFFSSTVASALQSELPVGLVKPADFYPDAIPQMLSVPTIGARKSDQEDDIPDDVRQTLNSVKKDPQQLAIAVNWTSIDPNTDVDIWLTVNGSREELNFMNCETSFGHLVRDVRHPGSIDDPNKDNWEIAVIKRRKLSDLRCWLNVYDGQQPSAVKVVLVHDGKEGSQSVSFPEVQGDKALASMFRSQSKAWLGPLNLLASR